MPTIFSGSHSVLKDYFGGTTHWAIPEYQREFSWGADNIAQLMRDIKDGIRRLDRADAPDVRAEKAAKFLGCIIQWERNSIPSEDFVVVPGIDYIGRVHELIDGQQRTSAITLLLCELYIEIGNLASSLDVSIEIEKELAGHLVRTVQNAWLLQRFSRVGRTGATNKRRPTLIRQGMDKWTHTGTIEYQSPIVAYIHKTIEAIELRVPLPVTTTDKTINEILNTIREHITLIQTQPLPIFAEHYTQSELFEELCSVGPTVDLEAYLALKPKNLQTITQIVTVVAFAHYLLNFAAFTVITSPNQSIALDMFQSLNSTGVQLTAVQLLKPRISQSFRENGDSFTADQSFKKFEKINDWLNSGRNHNSKTTQFFLKFGMGLLGQEPENNSLSVQRTWLMEQFKKHTKNGTDLSKTRNFVDLMEYTVDYLSKFFFKKRETLFQATPSVMSGGRNTYNQFVLTHLTSSVIFPLSDGGITAFMFLIDAKNDLAHSVLLNFYVYFQEADAAHAHAAKLEFEKALLTLSGFFLLWRAIFGIRYPDEVYRRVMNKTAYASGPHAGRARVLAKRLSKELLKTIRTDLPTVSRTKNSIACHISQRFRYMQGTKTLIRFFLLLACHKKTSPIPGSTTFVAHGLISPDASGPDYLFPDIWMGAPYSSIEHIAPQTLLDGTPGDWDPLLCTASDRIHSIGNLTLLSMPMNASTPEDPKGKKISYEGLVNPGSPPGVTPLAASIMSRSPNLAHLVPVYIRMSHWISEKAAGGPCVNEWNGIFIQQRAENLAAIVLDDIITWLTPK